MREKIAPICLALLTLCTLAISGGLQRAKALPAPSQAAASVAGPCDAAISMAEQSHQIPDRRLAAIGLVESGRRDPVTGRFGPWPWSINAEGQDSVFDTKAEAIAAVRALQARGVRSIDVGCMQVNLLQHPNAFDSLESAFDPARNATYAADFLVQLRGQLGGDWNRATAAYHSQTPGLADDYLRKVLAQKPDPATPGTAAPGAIGTASLPMANAPPGAGAIMLGNGAFHAHVIPMQNGGGGRDLASYRRAPVLVSGPFRRTS